MVKPTPQTRFAQILQASGLRQQKLADLSGTHKQSINRFVLGTRLPTVQLAKAMAPHLNVTWESLLETELLNEVPTTIQPRVVVGQTAPVFGEPLEDPDELALISFWRTLSVVKKAALFAHLGFDDMPSLRKSA